MKSLVPLKDTSVQFLELSETGVSDLTPLKGLNLRYLGIHKTNVKDYTVFRGMSIESLNAPIRTKADLAPLKGIQNLLYVNGKDAQELLK